jgi:hypothetical protein
LPAARIDAASLLQKIAGRLLKVRHHGAFIAVDFHYGRRAGKSQ